MNPADLEESLLAALEALRTARRLTLEPSVQNIDLCRARMAAAADILKAVAEGLGDSRPAAPAAETSRGDELPGPTPAGYGPHLCRPATVAARIQAENRALAALLQRTVAFHATLLANMQRAQAAAAAASETATLRPRLRLEI